MLAQNNAAMTAPDPPSQRGPGGWWVWGQSGWEWHPDPDPDPGTGSAAPGWTPSWPRFLLAAILLVAVIGGAGLITDNRDRAATTGVPEPAATVQVVRATPTTHPTPSPEPTPNLALAESEQKLNDFLGVTPIPAGGNPFKVGPVLAAACRRWVPLKLKAPATAQFPDEGLAWPNPPTSKTTYEARGDVDAQNGFGALIRARYQCWIKIEGDGKAHRYAVNIGDDRTESAPAKVKPEDAFLH